MSNDVIHLVLSDMHSGSNYALFVDRTWKGRKGMTHTPTSQQQRIRKHFIRFAEQVKELRKNKQIKLIHNGDAIDGDHHHSGDVCSMNPLEHADLHIELMNELQKRIGWRAGDELYYTRGTMTHVSEYENYIGRELNAIPDGDFYVWDMLELKTNGTLTTFVHHGPRRGDGANEGNALRNWLRAIYFDALKDHAAVPDVVYSGHVHDPTYSTYIYRDKMDFKAVHGVILPSWQGKTAYAWEKVPMNRNKVGGVWQEIKADGVIAIPHFSVM